MKKGMLSVSCGMLLMVISGLSQATEINLEGLHRNMGEQLFDGDILATGRIICRERHTGFHIQMNARQVEGRPGHYIVQGSKDTQSKLWVRLGGEGWSSPTGGGQQGIVRSGQEEQVIFDVMADGNQCAKPGEYIFSVSGKCLTSWE